MMVGKTKYLLELEVSIKTFWCGMSQSTEFTTLVKCCMVAGEQEHGILCLVEWIEYSRDTLNPFLICSFDNLLVENRVSD